MGRTPDVEVEAEVEVVQWPAEAARRDELAERRQPRLLLVAEDELPPPIAHDEDWARVTAPEQDVEARRQRLARRWLGRCLG